MRVLQVNPLVGMNFRQKGFALVIQIAQQPGQMAVTGIKHDMAVTQPFTPQAQQQGQGNFTFAPEFQHFRHAHLPATLRVIEPMLGHKQLAVDQGAGAISHQGSKDADLTVLLLTQATIPLPSYAGGLIALLREGRFIEDQSGTVAEVCIGIGNQLLPDLGSGLVRFAQHVMEPLIVATRHLLGNLLHVASVALEQSMEIALGRVFNRASLALETAQVGAEMIVKMDERRIDQTANAFRISRLSWRIKASSACVVCGLSSADCASCSSSSVMCRQFFTASRNVPAALCAAILPVTSQFLT